MNKPALHVVPAAGAGEPLHIPTHRIRRNKSQVRQKFKMGPLRELSASIVAIGQRQAGKVRIIDQKIELDPDHDYELIYGERRWRACKLGNVEEYLAFIGHPEDKDDQLLESLTENLFSEPNTIMEKSNALTRLRKTKSVQEITEALGKSDAWVYQYLSLQKLSASLKELTDPDIRKGRLNFDIAAVLVRVEDYKLQEEIFKKTLECPRRKRKAEVLKRVNAANGTGALKNRGYGSNVSVARETRPSEGARFIYEFAQNLPVDLERILGLNNRSFISFMSSRSKEGLTRIVGGLEQGQKDLEQLISALKGAMVKKTRF